MIDIAHFRHGSIVFGCLLAACVRPAGLHETEGTGISKTVFAYDSSIPSDLREKSADNRQGVTIRDLDYAAYEPRHGRIQAYLVEPEGAGPFAGVLFFHWLGEPNGDRGQFLDEAVALAGHGTVSLLIQGYFPWLEAPVDGPTDRQQVIDQVIEVRRALDLLLARPQVDAQRVGYVGHDYGAMHGAIVAGLENRIDTYILIAGMGNFGDWSLKYWPETASGGEGAYRQAMQGVDPIRYISRAAPAELLFQFADSDVYISEQTALAFYNAASEPKQIEWYEAAHDLNVKEAQDARLDWLGRQLDLAGADHEQGRE